MCENYGSFQIKSINCSSNSDVCTFVCNFFVFLIHFSNQSGWHYHESDSIPFLPPSHRGGWIKRLGLVDSIMMTSHNRVVQSVKEYFETLPIAGRVIDTEEPIAFGTRVGGFADVVLRSNRRFVAIAECKNPWDSTEAAKAQLKSYLCATGTLFGVLAIGKDPKKLGFL